MGRLITPQEPCYISYPYKFMNSYCYFPNNLKDITDHIQAYMISCKIFFQLMVTVFKENLNFQLLLIFNSSIRFVFETAFTSQQIVENRFGGLLEMSDNFITKFNVFSSMILQFSYNTVGKFQTILYDFKNSGQVFFF